MRHYYRFIILSTLFFTNSALAMQYFVDVLEWRATESNNWAYVNSKTLPNQTLQYKTIDFNYSPGLRVGVNSTGDWDVFASYTRYYTTTSDAADGGFIRPSFIGSVTAQPSTASLYLSGQVSQSINYNIFDVNVGKTFTPTSAWTLHPLAGLMGGWIDQTIRANYQQPAVSVAETITNNFIGLGPKVGIESSFTLFNYYDYQPKLFASMATAFLVGNWVVKDATTTVPTRNINVSGTSQSMGAITLQGSIGILLAYKNVTAKLAYEIGDWFNQSQYFDNDTGSHNNDLILQGLTLGISYNG